ncbi:hypothetical protein OSB04_010036 [Centaurea solstitialis]|uniref:Uncharacterized protein n=1 Tax=Centaurea solstitialis TaxID=347529 RepID=A0AA38WCG0_9ASTR|nr:hypothetical protein OSB04_010036 [Centaurea solstitialis]
MFSDGCTAEGSLNDSKFNDPMPWIGIYVGRGIALCRHGHRRRLRSRLPIQEVLVPLQILHFKRHDAHRHRDRDQVLGRSEAAMPRRQDQLAKVSSSAFICMVMGNLLPSLGTMEDTELLMNIVALGILVITAITNICIQMATGVIFEFWIEHVLIMLLMLDFACNLVLFIIGCSNHKVLLELTYEKKLKKAKGVFPSTEFIGGRAATARFREVLDDGVYLESPVRDRPVRTVLGFRGVLSFQSVILAESYSGLESCRGRSDFAVGKIVGFLLQNDPVRFHLFVSRFLRLKKLINRDNSISSHDSERELERNPNTSLRHYVIYLEGEEALVDLMMENNLRCHRSLDPDRSKEKAARSDQTSRPIGLVNFFTGVQDFDSDKVPIAVALPNIDERLVEQLVCGVDEGLKFVNEIENHLDEKKDLKHVRKAAEIVWSGVELYNKWLDVDLQKLASRESETGPEIIKQLAEISKQKFMEFADKDMVFMNECLQDAPSRWPIKVLAANSMYRICKTLLLEPEKGHHETAKASFTNLQRVISSKCHQTRIEERDKSIRSAVLLFGKTKKILEILERKRPEVSDHGRLVHIDDWHLVIKQMRMDSLHSLSCSSTDQETAASSPDLCISIE